MTDMFVQAVMVVADSKQSLTITGNGDVLEPHDGVIGTCCTAAIYSNAAGLHLSMPVLLQQLGQAAHMHWQLLGH